MSFTFPNVHSVKYIPAQPNVIPEEVLQLPHLNDIKVNVIPGASLDLLIGADVPELFCIYSYRKGSRGAPCAVETPLGWSLLSPSLPRSLKNHCQVNFVSKTQELMEDTIVRMWQSEFDLGTSIFKVPHSKEDRISLTTMKSQICEIDGHYQLPLLWKNEAKSSPNNLSLAQKRLGCLKRRLIKDETLMKKYNDVIDNYIANGYARKVPETKSCEREEESITWYLPHHPVVNIHKPEKVRVVFDCAAKYNECSLNDVLIKGPHLMNNLTGVLIRFRKERVTLVGDIEAMFHQVKVDPAHVNALRFLWWENGNLLEEPVAYQMLVHLFGATSSPSCANFSLRRTAHEFGHLYKPIISSVINHNFYVDDCLISLSTVKKTIAVQHDLTEMLARRGFRLTKWITNNKQVLDAIPTTEQASKAHLYLLESIESDRVLGVHWQVTEDQFTFDARLPNKALTRRGILSMVASLYDPLGFASPVLLNTKRLLQSLCKEKTGWYQVIDELKTKLWFA